MDGDLLEEAGLLAARVPTHHPGLLQPEAQPGQVAVTHVRVGQQVAERTREEQSVATSC